MNFSYEFFQKDRPKVKMKNVLRTKTQRNFLEGQK